MSPPPGRPSVMASRASSRRLSARAWLTCPSMSGSDQRSWTRCSCRTSGQIGGLGRLAGGALGGVGGGGGRALPRPGQGELGPDLLPAAPPPLPPPRGELGPRPDVVLGDVVQRLGARLLLRRHVRTAAARCPGPVPAPPLGRSGTGGRPGGAADRRRRGRERSPRGPWRSAGRARPATPPC